MSGSGFVTTFAAALLAGLLLTSGIGHALRWRSFAAVISEHGVVPAWLNVPSALTVVVVELTLGLAALAVALGAGAVPARLVFAGSMAVGAFFAAYLAYLLRARRTVGGCGCSPLQSPLTTASLTPGLAMLAAAGLGLGVATAPPGGAVQLLASLWGVTLSGIVLLVPAIAPQPAGEAGYAARLEP